MSTSKPGAKAPGTPLTQPGAPPSTPAPNAYARFIPREELGGNVAAWAPQTFERPPAAPMDAGVRKPTLAELLANTQRPVASTRTISDETFQIAGLGQQALL